LSCDSVCVLLGGLLDLQYTELTYFSDRVNKRCHDFFKNSVLICLIVELIRLLGKEAGGMVLALEELVLG